MNQDSFDALSMGFEWVQFRIFINMEEKSEAAIHLKNRSKSFDFVFCVQLQPFDWMKKTFIAPEEQEEK